MSARPRVAAGPVDPRTFRGQRWRRCDGGMIEWPARLEIYFRAPGAGDQLAKAAAAKVGQSVVIRLPFGSVTYTREA